MVGYNALCDGFPLIYLCMNRIFHATIMYSYNAAIMLIFIYAPTEKCKALFRRSFIFMYHQQLPCLLLFLWYA